MNRMIKMVTIVAGVGAMLGFAGCGDNSTATSSPVMQNGAKSTSAISADSAKDVAMKKLKDTGFDKVEFVSEKITGDKSLVVAKVTADGTTEETKVYCSRVGGKWMVTKLD